MKLYIVFVDGVELPKDQWVRAANQNAAEKKAKAKLQARFPNKDISVAYTEI